MPLLLVVAACLIQAWTWRTLARRVAAGTLTKGRAIVRYVLWSGVPVAALTALVLVAVSLEEWTGLAVFEEAVARAVVPGGLVLLGVAALGALAFGMRLVWLTPAGRTGR